MSQCGSFEPRREKTGFLHMRKQRRSAFVFASWIVQSLFYLKPKFQASSHLVWLYSPVYVGPGRKPRRPVFSQRGSFIDIQPTAMQTQQICDCVLKYLSLVVRKPVFGVSDQVPHKPGCTATEDGYRLEIRI